MSAEVADLVIVIVAVLGVACAPVLYLRLRRGAGWAWFMLGIASWTLALVAKAILALPLLALHPPAVVEGIVGGFMSAATELGMAALFLGRRPLASANVLAFGTGIGAFEVVFTLLLWAAGVGGADGDAGRAGMATGLAGAFYLLERAVTLVGHVASRVLVYVALRGRRLLPAAIAIAFFACIDGTAAYGDAAGWDWESVRVRSSFMAFVTVVGAWEAVAAWWFWRNAASAPAAGAGAREQGT